MLSTQAGPLCRQSLLCARSFACVACLCRDLLHPHTSKHTGPKELQYQAAQSFQAAKFQPNSRPLCSRLPASSSQPGERCHSRGVIYEPHTKDSIPRSELPQCTGEGRFIRCFSSKSTGLICHGCGPSRDARGGSSARQGDKIISRAKCVTSQCMAKNLPMRSCSSLQPMATAAATTGSACCWHA